MIEVRLLGSIDLRGDDGREVTAILAQPKRLALLVYLAAARPRGFQRRDKLVALFWPNFDGPRARQALNKTVHHLRRVIGEAAILSRGDEELAIDETLIRCDVRAFDDAIVAGNLEAALVQYRGDFADGLFIDEAPEFDQWLSAERDRLRTAAAKAAGSLAEREDVVNSPTAVEWARRATELAPFDEVAVRRLMVSLEQLGNRAGAARAYDDFARRLMDDLGLVPSAQTKALRASPETDVIDGSRHSARPFVAPTAAPISSIAAAARELSGAIVPDLVPSPANDRDASRRRPRRALRIGVGAAVVVASVVAGVLARGSSKHSATTKLDDTRLLVAVLENRTGDSTLNVLGPMASDWITQGLSNADIVRVVDSRNALMLSRSGGRSTQELANESGAGLVIFGAYYNQGDSIRFQVQLASANGDDGVRAFQPVVAPSKNPTEALEALRQQALSIVAQARAPQLAAMVRANARPPLYTAYREYIEGVDLYVHRDLERAYGHFLRAAQLDTTFTVALLSAASLAQNIGARSVDSLVGKLALQRDSLSAPSRLWLDAMVAGQRGDIREASRLLGDLSRAVPESSFPYTYAMSLFFTGQVRHADAVVRGIDPQRGWMNGFFSYWVARALLDHLLGDQIAEEADVVAGERQYPRNIAVATARARLIGLNGRRAQLDSLFDEVVSIPPVPGWDAGSVMAVAALEAAAHGRTDWVPAIRARALQWYNAIPAAGRQQEPGQFGLTWVLYSVGAWPELEVRVARLERESPTSRRWLAVRGVIAAHAGDTTTARQIDNALARASETGERGVLIAASLHMDRARIAAMLGERDTAVEFLRQALAAGAPFTGYLHTDPAFASLKDYPPFARLITPKD